MDDRGSIPGVGNDGTFFFPSLLLPPNFLSSGYRGPSLPSSTGVKNACHGVLLN
jgi:hypothetical protein